MAEIHGGTPRGVHEGDREWIFFHSQKNVVKQRSAVFKVLIFAAKVDFFLKTAKKFYLGF
jgi:hypothetical protein